MKKKLFAWLLVLTMLLTLLPVMALAEEEDYLYLGFIPTSSPARWCVQTTPYALRLYKVMTDGSGKASPVTSTDEIDTDGTYMIVGHLEGSITSGNQRPRIMHISASTTNQCQITSGEQLTGDLTIGSCGNQHQVRLAAVPDTENGYSIQSVATSTYIDPSLMTESSTTQISMTSTPFTFEIVDAGEGKFNLRWARPTGPKEPEPSTPEQPTTAHTPSDDHINVYLNFSGGWGNTKNAVSMTLAAAGNNTPEVSQGLCDNGTYTIYDSAGNPARYMHVGPSSTQTDQCSAAGTNYHDGAHAFVFHKTEDEDGEVCWNVESNVRRGYYLTTNDGINKHPQLQLTTEKNKAGKFYIWQDSASGTGRYFMAWEQSFVYREPHLVLNHYSGRDAVAPMDKNAVHSNYFRIPGITTLSNGWQVAVSDIRWQSANDNPANMDTIVSISKDNGKTWDWETLNYVSDWSVETDSNLSASFIDPAIVQAPNGDVWVAVDLTPFMPGGGRGGLSNQGTGYDEHGCMLVTDVGENPSSSVATPKDPDSFGYRVDFSGERGGVYSAQDLWGATHDVYPIFSEDSGAAVAIGMYVDTYFNLYAMGETGTIEPVQCQQYGTIYDDWTQNNILYAQSQYRLFPTFYFCLRRGHVSGDGITWDEPIYPNVRNDLNNYFFGVCPGRGTIWTNPEGGTRIVFQCYDNRDGKEYASVFYSDDNGETWHRGVHADKTNYKTSESQSIVLPNGNLRMYSRNDTGTISCHDSADGGETWISGALDSALSYCGNCMVSFINVEGTLIGPDGREYRDLIMGSYPKTSGRANGTVRIGYMDGGTVVNWLPSNGGFDNKLTGSFAYSCLTQMFVDGKPGDGFAILWEPGHVACNFNTFNVSDVLGQGYYLKPNAPSAQLVAELVGEITITDDNESNTHSSASYSVPASAVNVTTGSNVNLVEGVYTAEATVSLETLLTRFNNDSAYAHTFVDPANLSVTLVYDPAAGWTISGELNKDIHVICQNPVPVLPPVTTTTPGDDEDIADEDVPLAGVLPYADVAQGDWFYDAAFELYQSDVMTGVTGETFVPHAPITRATVVTVLYRLENEPESGVHAFDDVASGAWFEEAVAWGAQHGVVKGLSDSSFGPDREITREQLAAILYRYAGLRGYDTTGRADLGRFTDAGKASGYAVEALRWAAAAGLINGRASGALDPTGTATRAETAVILSRFINTFVNTQE